MNHKIHNLMYYIVKRSLLFLYFLFPVQPPTLYSWCSTVSSLAAIIIRDRVCVYFLCLIEIARTKNWLLKQENLMSGRITRDFVLLTWGGDTVVHTFTSTQKPTDSPCFSAEGEMHHVMILLGPGRNETHVRRIKMHKCGSCWFAEIFGRLYQ